MNGNFLNTLFGYGNRCWSWLRSWCCCDHARSALQSCGISVAVGSPEIQDSPLPMFLSADGARIDLWRLEPSSTLPTILFGVCYRFIFSRFAAGFPGPSTPSLPKLRPLQRLT